MRDVRTSVCTHVRGEAGQRGGRSLGPRSKGPAPVQKVFGACYSDAFCGSVSKGASRNDH